MNKKAADTSQSIANFMNIESWATQLHEEAFDLFAWTVSVIEETHTTKITLPE